MEQRDWPHYSAARKAAAVLNAAGFEAYIIGGAVRDLLLGKTPKDFDLATNARPEDILACKDFERSHYKDTGQAYGVTRVYVAVESESEQLTREIELEIATYRQDIEAHLGRKQTKVAFSSLADDIQRRDFTINALAFDPISNQVIDQVEGIEDLGRKLIRFIGRPSERIQEDPLRILRAIRLKFQLGFNFETETERALQRAITDGKLDEIAIERVKFELTRMLMHPQRKPAYKELDRLGALDKLLPELTATKDVPQPENIHAEGDVFTHSLLSIGYLPDIISPRLGWATLLHDTGKAVTYAPQEEAGERIRFNGHHQAGADIALRLLKRLRFGKRFRDEVAWMIHYHLGIDDLPKMRPRRADSLMRHPAFSDLLELHRADAHAAWSRNRDNSLDTGPATFNELERMWSDFQHRRHQRAPSLKHDLGIDGNWLMREFDLEKGPRLGVVLAELEEAYLEDRVHNEDDVRQLVIKILAKTV